MKFMILLFILSFTVMAESVSHYQYADGSGNVYRLSPYQLQYEPVTPELSSSGIYSGGQAVQKNLTHDQYEKIVQLFQAAITNKTSHIQQRVMGSGLIIIDQQQTILLAQSAKEKQLLEQFLQSILK